MLKITAEQYLTGTLDWQRKVREGYDLRLGQHLVNLFAPESGEETADLFYCENRDVPRHLEIT